MAGSTTDIVLRNKRDRDVVDRFNYYYNVKRFRYDYVLYLMKWNHFYLNERRLHKILKQQGIKVPPLSDSFKNSTVNEVGLDKFQARNEALRKRFEDLYIKDQLRIDDTTEILRKEFYINERTIDAILCEWERYKTLVTTQTTINFDQPNNKQDELD